jgi:hypothetical protein
MTALKWYLVVCVSALVAGWAVWSGYALEIFETDQTYLSSVTFLTYVLATGYFGYALHTGRTPRWDWLEFVDVRLVQMGLAGTVVGMLIVLRAFWTGANFELAEAYAHIGTGAATALYTTIVGMGCSEFLKLQMKVVR